MLLYVVLNKTMVTLSRHYYCDSAIVSESQPRPLQRTLAFIMTSDRSQTLPQYPYYRRDM